MLHYELKTPQTQAEWDHYHNIRRTVLYEGRGRFGIYRENHSDEKMANHFPMLLYFRGVPVGTVRIDLSVDDGAVLRLVAIDQDAQGKGHGKALLKLAERFVHMNGRRWLLTNAAKDAVGFYKAYGFKEELWDATQINDRSVQMRKLIGDRSTELKA